MNQYIRTKDGEIFEYGGREKTPYGDIISTNGKHYRYDCTFKQSDTIEELFDQFVLISGTNRNCNPFLITIETTITGTKEVVFKDDSGHHSIAYHKKQNDLIYGAIWTDKGLIYKARMNRILSNGEIDWVLL